MICNTRKVMRACFLLCLTCIGSSLFAQAPTKESFTYGVEWRLVRAGVAKISVTPLHGTWQGDVHLESAGLVSKLYKIEDNYGVTFDDQLCARSTFMKAMEGKRQRETKVTFDRARGKASYLERDLLKNTTVLAKETDTPNCVAEWVSGLYKVRSMKLEPGQSGTIPMSDGKRFAQVKVEAQEREEVTTPLGKFKTIRYEVFVFDGALIPRKARAFVWLTDDAKKTPVQIRVRMQFLIGTINLQLEKEEH
jgi:hypothetical protein